MKEVKQALECQILAKDTKNKSHRSREIEDERIKNTETLKKMNDEIREKKYLKYLEKEILVNA